MCRATAPARLSARQRVAAQMRRARLVGPTEPQQRQQRQCQHAVRLLGAGLLAGEHGGPGVQRRGVLTLLGQPGAAIADLAGRAVGHLVAGRGPPFAQRRPGASDVAEMRRDGVLRLPHGPRRVARDGVAATHLAVPGLDGGEAHVGCSEHAGRDPLEVPVQTERVVGVESAGGRVPQPQQMRERNELPAFVAGVFVRLDQVDQRLDQRLGLPHVLRLGEQLLGRGRLGQAARALAVLLQGVHQRGEIGKAAHAVGYSAGGAAAHSSRPERVRLTRA